MSLSSDKYENFVKSVKINNTKEMVSNFHIEYFDRKDKYGLKPIHWACLSSNIEILEWMLKEKCDIETASRNGWRPIHFASFIGNHVVVTFLIENFCNLDCETNIGETVLDVVNGNCNHEFIDEILNENINLKIGLSMGLKCSIDCKHDLCLRSVIQCKFTKNEPIIKKNFMFVYKIKDSQSRQLFAMKTYERSYFDALTNTKFIWPNINEILVKLHYPKIVKYYGVIRMETEVILFMEFMNNGSLWNHMRKNGVLKYEKISNYCEDILLAVEFLHNNQILHRFINPSNIFIDNNGGCKLAISIYSCSLEDGGDQLDKKLMNSNYIYPFAAPEIINNELLSYPFDIWWLGCTVILLLTGKTRKYQWDAFDELDKIVTEISNEMLQSFIKNMLMRNPTERSTASELLNHEFIKNQSIDNSDNHQIIIDNSVTNSEISINIIQNAINNKQIGLSMGLKCEDECQHKFCLSSVTATNFKKGKNIGEGAGGKVYKIELKSGDYWAMKVIKNIGDENIKNEAKYFEDDINRFRELINHENIVKYFGAVRNLKKIFIFMEFIDGESLYEKIKRNKCKPLELSEIKQYTKQILEGLKFLHEQNIIHRDIKSANILINEKNILKIADFGVSRFLGTISKHKNKSFCGTYNYMSPEVINEEPYNCSADIWSLGATVFEMASGHPPYHESNEAAVIIKIGQTRKIQYPPDLSNDMKLFLNSMINADPENRSCAKSLLNCEFFN